MRTLVLLAVVLTGCGGGDAIEPDDAGPVDAGPVDAGPRRPIWGQPLGWIDGGLPDGGWQDPCERYQGKPPQCRDGGTY